jgi:hypothetical protein
VFPKKFLEGKIVQDQIDALANIAVIGPTINIRIGAKDPMDYIDRYKISPSKLADQFVEQGVAAMTIDGFPMWLNNRAARLAAAGNEFLASLRGTPALAG